MLFDVAASAAATEVIKILETQPFIPLVTSPEVVIKELPDWTDGTQPRHLAAVVHGFISAKRSRGSLWFGLSWWTHGKNSPKEI